MNRCRCASAVTEYSTNCESNQFLFVIYLVCSNKPWFVKVITYIFFFNLGYLHKLGSRPLQHTLHELSLEYGEIFSLNIGTRLIVVLNSKRSAKLAFVKQAKIFSGRPDFPTFTVARLGAVGVSLCDYSEDYKNNRRAVVKAMHNFISDSENSNNLLHMESVKLIKRFEECIDKNNGIIDPCEEFYAIVPAISMHVIFGKSLEYKDPTLISLVKCNKKFFDSAASTNPADFIKFVSLFPNKNLKHVKESSLGFYDFISKQIKKPSYSNSMLQNISQHRFHENPNKVSSPKELAKIIGDVLGGGFDTVAATLSWAFLCFSTNKDIYEKCRKDIKSVGKDLLKMGDEKLTPYYVATIYELFRYYPAAPTGIPHCTLADTTLDKHFIPKGTTVFVNIHAVNRDPELWTKPNSFYPEHFLLENGEFDSNAKRNIESFSSGIRSCPGQVFSFHEMYIILGAIIVNFDVDLYEPPIDYLPIGGLTSQPKKYTVKLSKAK